MSRALALTLLLFLAACDEGEVPPETGGPLVRGERLDGAATDPEAGVEERPGPRLTAPSSPTPSPSPTPTPTPGAEGGPRAITFGDLSLVGADVEGLLDAMFEEVAEPTFEYPAEVAALDGLDVELVGYMIALDYREDGGVSEFMLVRDLAACCFGGMPRPDEWVHVTMADGEGSDLFMMVPFVVRGILSVGLEREDGGFLSSAYQLVGTATRPR